MLYIVIGFAYFKHGGSQAYTIYVPKKSLASRFQHNTKQDYSGVHWLGIVRLTGSIDKNCTNRGHTLITMKGVYDVVKKGVELQDVWITDLIQRIESRQDKHQNTK